MKLIRSITTAGVYTRTNDRLEFRRVPPPTRAELGEILRS